MDEQQMNKVRWLRPAMSGDDQSVIAALTAALPTTESLDAEGMKQMERARLIMAELFLRGVSYRQFNLESELFGFPIVPLQPGMTRHKIMGDRVPVYYSLWLLEKDAALAAAAVKNTLLFRKESSGEHAGYYRVQLHLDVDTTAKKHPMPNDVGLTKHAFCLEFPLSETEQHFEHIEAACRKLCVPARQKIRFALGCFAEHEFNDFARLSVTDRRIPFGMTSEFVLFKSIHRRVKAQSKRA